MMESCTLQAYIDGITIAEWRPDGQADEEIGMLAEVLHAAVNAGASVSFILPFPIDDAIAFWERKVVPFVAAGTRRVLIAKRGARIVGTVQLELCMPPNQEHRAEVLKLLVHPAARRLGIARALMLALEDVARAANRTLITLDTRTGDLAEPLYKSLGYLLAGIIPRYARKPHSPDLDATSLMYKELV